MNNINNCGILPTLEEVNNEVTHELDLPEFCKEKIE